MLRAASRERDAAGVSGARGPRGLVLAVLLGSLLPGCPLSDNYYIDRNLGVAGGAPMTEAGGTGGSDVIAGGPAVGGSSGSAVETGGVGGSSGAATPAGTGGDVAMTGGTGGDVSGNGGAGGSTGGTGGSAAEGGADMAGGSDGMAGTSGCVPEPERCDGISNDCDDEIDEDSVCPANCTARTRDGHLYLLCFSDDPDAAVSAEDASLQNCPDLGTQLELKGDDSFGLVWVESADENAFLKAWLAEDTPGSGVVWMAANDDDSEGDWVWGRRTEAEMFFTGGTEGGGSPYMDRFNDWAPDEPNGGSHDDVDCAAFDPALDWQWEDELCTTLEPGFLCEEHPAAQ